MVELVPNSCTTSGEILKAAAWPPWLVDADAPFQPSKQRPVRSSGHREASPENATSVGIAL